MPMLTREQSNPMAMPLPRSTPTIDLPPLPPAKADPRQVDFILSALAAGGMQRVDRRANRRLPYRVEAQLQLYSDQADTQPCLLYTKDAYSRGVGFITQRR